MIEEADVVVALLERHDHLGDERVEFGEKVEQVLRQVEVHARSIALFRPSRARRRSLMRQNGAMAATFTRMDESTAEQWAVIGRETNANQGRVAERVLMLLRSLADITDGFSCDQLTHCLQTATLAQQAGADDEVVVASLCHDIGKAISVPNHGPIAAEMLRPYVRPDVVETIRNHQHFQGKHYYHYFGMPTDMREQFATRAGSPCAKSSPTSGTRRRSTRTATPNRSSTSSRWCARSSPSRATDRGPSPPAQTASGRGMLRIAHTAA